MLERIIHQLSTSNVAPNAETEQKIKNIGTAPVRPGMTLLDLLRRGDVTYKKLAAEFALPELPEVVAEQAELFAKYEGYINKQKQEVERALKLENKLIPQDID